jgi:hypothetical protein
VSADCIHKQLRCCGALLLRGCRTMLLLLLLLLQLTACVAYLRMQETAIVRCSRLCGMLITQAAVHRLLYTVTTIKCAPTCHF